MDRMSAHIVKFIDKVKMLESKQAKNITMTMREAKDLHSDITKLLIVLQELQSTRQQDDTLTKIEITGGDF